MTAATRWIAAAVLAWLGCGGERAAPAPKYPQANVARPATAGSELLAHVPAGADVVIELDLARVRANAVVGELFARATETGEGAAGGWLGADVVLFCGYAVGTPDAANVMIARGGTPPEGALRLDEHTVAFGPPALLERVEALATRRGQAMTGDGTFMRLRDAAMPAKATAAAVRLTARLPFDARVGMSQLFEADAVPAAVSLWADVVDDLAVVALLSGETNDDGAALSAEVAALRTRLGMHPVVRAWRLGDVVQRIESERVGSLTRAVLVIGPSALERVVRRLNRRLAAR